MLTPQPPHLLAQEREITHARLQAAAPRLGSLGVRRRGIEVQEVWLI